MRLASRDLIGGNKWVADNAEDPDIAKATEKAKKAFAGQEIKGKKLGVIGLGAIGQLVANAAIALGMEVYGYDPYVSVKAAWNLSSEVKYISDVKDIYKECNYITVHVPALDSTKGMINKEAFDLMQDGTVIINCARDVLVDEAAIGEALKSGRVCATKGRITVCHKNVPTVISKITTVLGAAGINISSMANQSRGDYAYSLLDIEASAPEAVVEELSAIEGVIKVRVIK